MSCKYNPISHKIINQRYFNSTFLVNLKQSYNFTSEKYFTESVRHQNDCDERRVSESSRCQKMPLKATHQMLIQPIGKLARCIWSRKNIIVERMIKLTG